MSAVKIRPVRRACAFSFYMGILYGSFSDGINIKNPANRIAAPFAGHSAQNLIGDDHALVLCVKAAQTAAGHNIFLCFWFFGVVVVVNPVFFVIFYLFFMF